MKTVRPVTPPAELEKGLQALQERLQAFEAWFDSQHARKEQPRANSGSKPEYWWVDEEPESDGLPAWERKSSLSLAGFRGEA